MTVSPDGLQVCTDPGVGVLAPGWHGENPSNPNEGGDGRPDDDPRDEEKPINNGNPTRPGCGEEENGTDPVYLHSGEFFEPVEDLRIKGVGFDFVWSRKYRSKIGPNTAQGNGWDFSYNIFIKQSGSVGEVE